RPGASMRRTIAVRVRRWTADHGKTPIRGLDVRNRTWAAPRRARAQALRAAAAVADTKVAVKAADAKGTAAINEKIEGLRWKAEPLFAGRAVQPKGSTRLDLRLGCNAAQRGRAESPR